MIRLLPHWSEYPSTNYPEAERILEVAFSGDEGIDFPTYAVVDLDMDGNLPDDLDDEIRFLIRRRMGRAKANRYKGYEDVTDYLNSINDDE